MENGITQVKVEGRLNNGPIAAEGDWPGTFFRGDTSDQIASMLEFFAERLGDDGEPLLKLAADFKACGVSQDYLDGR